MFFEVHRGYIGLGATEVFRTAAQVANDITTFGKDAGEIGQQGGLYNLQNVFKYAASKGRLADLQTEVVATDSRIQGLQAQVAAKVRELENLGVMKAGDYAKMAGKMVAGKAIPLIGWLSAISMFGSMLGIDLSFLDVFGSAKKKKRKAEQLIRDVEALLKQMAYWADRAASLQKEGEALAKAHEEGPAGVTVKLIELPQQKVRGGPPVDMMTPLGEKSRDTSAEIHAYNTMKMIEKPEPRAYGVKLFATKDELSQRTRDQIGPTGDRLPVGFQTIYSPVLEGGKIVAQVAQKNAILPGPVDRRIVYGGLLSGLVADESHMVFNTVALGGFVVLALMILRQR